MQLFRCRICGDGYFGGKKPTNCPFCGAKGGNLVLAEKWVDENNIALTAISRRNLVAARLIEIKNTNFYFEASARAKAEHVKITFKTLGKIEREHAAAITKILKDQLPEVTEAEQVFGRDGENMAASNKREKTATMLYKRFASEATEPRVKFFFDALSKIEHDHINITAGNVD